MIDFNRDRNEGQMLPDERASLYNLILMKKPEIVFEIGTWKGGGSTFFISSALHANNFGRLFTIECEKEFYDHAINLYHYGNLIYLNQYIVFHFGESHKVYPNILKKIGKVDVLFLDGKEDPDQTILEYRIFEPYLVSNSYLACHDWNISKMIKLREILKDDNSWELYSCLPNGPTGFAILRKK